MEDHVMTNARTIITIATDLEIARQRFGPTQKLDRAKLVCFYPHHATLTSDADIEARPLPEECAALPPLIAACVAMREHAQEEVMFVGQGASIVGDPVGLFDLTPSKTLALFTRRWPMFCDERFLRFRAGRWATHLEARWREVKDQVCDRVTLVRALTHCLAECTPITDVPSSWVQWDVSAVNTLVQVLRVNLEPPTYHGLPTIEPVSK